MRGLLIAFEGLDRCGKTTQARLLKKYFDPSLSYEEIKKAQLIHFPRIKYPFCILSSFLF